MLEPAKPATIPPAPPVVQAGGTLPVPPPAVGADGPSHPDDASRAGESSARAAHGCAGREAGAASGRPAAAACRRAWHSRDAKPVPDTDPLIKASTVTKLDPAPLATAVNAAAAQAKYRILLRVGEGEPVFEVRSGDALLLKVVCEKVDVKSPEKGQGLSALKACGKVRFAGFGAEGTCDQLNFLAGTGEVAMSGNVKIQVKDKLGRVESESSAELMKYKIDPHEISGHGQLKP